MKQPNNVVEVFFSMLKWFLMILIVNNLIWATVLILATSSEEITFEQDGK